MAEDLTKRVDRLERDFGASMQQIAHSLSDIESTQFDHAALLKGHSRALVDIRKQMATKAEVEALHTEMGELRTQVLASFQQVLAVLDERLPGKEK